MGVQKQCSSQKQAPVDPELMALGVDLGLTQRMLSASPQVASSRDEGHTCVCTGAQGGLGWRLTPTRLLLHEYLLLYPVHQYIPSARHRDDDQSCLQNA